MPNLQDDDARDRPSDVNTDARCLQRGSRRSLRYRNHLPDRQFSSCQRIVFAGVLAMRSAVVILILCGLILLAFSPVWYETLAGENRVIVDSVDTSFALAVDAPLAA
jgi:thiosulfate reductase cytochrome b subunit